MLTVTFKTANYTFILKLLNNSVEQAAGENKGERKESVRGVGEIIHNTSVTCLL